MFHRSWLRRCPRKQVYRIKKIKTETICVLSSKRKTDNRRHSTLPSTIAIESHQRMELACSVPDLVPSRLQPKHLSSSLWTDVEFVDKYTRSTRTFVLCHDEGGRKDSTRQSTLHSTCKVEYKHLSWFFGVECLVDQSTEILITLRYISHILQWQQHSFLSHRSLLVCLWYIPLGISDDLRPLPG